MVRKNYDWPGGAVLEEHSRKKHAVIRQYFSDYVAVRCRLPKRESFRLAVVDGFSGGGRYGCGAPGSPLIFLEEISQAANSINLGRAAQGIPPVHLDCLMIFNDANRDAYELLKENIAPLHAYVKDSSKNLSVKIVFMNDDFNVAYEKIRNILAKDGRKNVIFNLDQCGYSLVRREILLDVMKLCPSVEVFYTFAIESLISFLHQRDPEGLRKQLAPLGVSKFDLEALQPVMSKRAWLGEAERMVFNTFGHYADYVTPFSINNPDGWRYWLIHLANSYRARQVYNDVLHNNASAQAHCGRAGLFMLQPSGPEEQSLFLFDESAREIATAQLMDDIPRVISQSGDVMPVEEFYQNFYNTTPAHADDIHKAIIDSPDITVITQQGGERRCANTICATDTLKLKPQKSFFQYFGGSTLKVD